MQPIWVSFATVSNIITQVHSLIAKGIMQGTFSAPFYFCWTPLSNTSIVPFANILYLSLTLFFIAHLSVFSATVESLVYLIYLYILNMNFYQLKNWIDCHMTWSTY